MLRNRAVLPRLEYLLAFEVAADLESNTVSADYYYSLYYVKRSAQNDYAW